MKELTIGQKVLDRFFSKEGEIVKIARDECGRLFKYKVKYQGLIGWERWEWPDFIMIIQD